MNDICVLYLEGFRIQQQRDVQKQPAVKGAKYCYLEGGVEGSYEQLPDRGENQSDSESLEGFGQVELDGGRNPSLQRSIWIELCLPPPLPQNTLEILITRACEHDLIWKLGLQM